MAKKVQKEVLDVGTGANQIPQNDGSGNLDADTLQGKTVGAGANQIPVRDGLGVLDADTVGGNLPSAFATSGHTHATLPSSGEKDALAGTTGTPGAANKFVTQTDTRLAPVGTVPATVLSGDTKVQSGKSANTSSGTGNVNFPQAFSTAPVVIAVFQEVTSGATDLTLWLDTVSTTGFSWISNGSGLTKLVHWVAIGS